jgi:hypothetical protein
LFKLKPIARARAFRRQSSHSRLVRFVFVFSRRPFSFRVPVPPSFTRVVGKDIHDRINSMKMMIHNQSINQIVSYLSLSRRRRDRIHGRRASRHRFGDVRHGRCARLRQSRNTRVSLSRWVDRWTERQRSHQSINRNDVTREIFF